jgi:polo-like kinase 4
MLILTNLKKISDFGLATKLVPEEKHFTLCGTPNFISPEIASRSAHGLEADVWSLGCMMFTFLTGKPPFDTDGIKDTLSKVVQAKYEMPTFISKEAQDLIFNLLKKNPQERIPLNKVLDHPFMTKKHLVFHKIPSVICFQQMNGSNQPHSISSASSSSFKQAASFNESIDSGRGTLTTSSSQTNNTSLHQQNRNSYVISKNLQLSNDKEMHNFNLKNHNQNLSLRGISSVSNDSSSSKINNAFNNSNLLSSEQTISFTKNVQHAISNNDLTDSKNLYYNRFLKQEKNIPNSPPVKLLNSPTKLSKFDQQQNLAKSYQNHNSNDSNNIANSYILNPSSINDEKNDADINYFSSNTLLSQKSLNINPTSSWENISSTKLNSDEINHLNNNATANNKNQLDSTSSFYSSNVNSNKSSSFTSNMNFNTSSQIVNNNNVIRKNTRGKKLKDESNEKKLIEEHVSPVKSSSTLLRPTRQVSKSAVLNIMERNEVVLELIKVKRNQQYIVEVIRIDAEKDCITIYQPNNGKGCIISNKPPPIPTERNMYSQFDYKNLPQNYWKKYDLASR